MRANGHTAWVPPHDLSQLPTTHDKFVYFYIFILHLCWKSDADSGGL